MKIIEALKTTKANKAKVTDLIAKIKANSAILSNQTSPYGGVTTATLQVSGWVDSIRQILRDNEALTNRVHRTNNSVQVSIDIGGDVITKSIDEWLTRRNGNIDLQAMSLSALTDRGLKEEFVAQPDGTRQAVTLVRHFDARVRDEFLASLASEKAIVDNLKLRLSMPPLI